MDGTVLLRGQSGLGPRPVGSSFLTWGRETRAFACAALGPGVVGIWEVGPQPAQEVVPPCSCRAQSSKWL